MMDPISPLRPGTPPPTERWACTDCGATSSEKPAIATMSDDYREGYCLTCRKRRLWMRIKE